MNDSLNENQVLALFAPHIEGRVDIMPPEDYDGGIPIGAVNEDLYVLIDPWVKMSIFDKVELFWSDTTAPVASMTIHDPSKLDQPVLLRIDECQVLDGDASVFYRVTRISANPADSTPLKLLVKLTRPGGLDESPEEGHSGFRFTLTPDVSSGVDLAMAEQGIVMRIEPYKNMAPYDRITARWGSQKVTFYPVTKQHITHPSAHPIELTFTKDIITAHGDGTDVEVTFQAVDRVGNYPDPKAPWAKKAHVMVDLSANRLSAPVVLFNNKPVTTIDLAQLADSDVIVRVSVTTGDFAVGDVIDMTWNGTPAQGQPIIVKPEPQTIGSLPDDVLFIIPNATVKAIAKGSALASYVRSRRGVADRPSNKAKVNVEGEVTLLPPPIVREAVNGSLDPNVYQGGFTVQFDSAALLPSDQIELTVIGRAGDGSTGPLIKTVSGQVLEFNIEAAITGANLGKSVVLHFKLIRAGQATPGHPVTLNIENLLEKSMPQPLLADYSGDVIDLGSIMDSAEVVCFKWPFQRADLPVWLSYKETRSDGSSRVKALLIGNAHAQGEGLRHPAEVSWLRQCQTGSELDIDLKVGMFHGATVSDAVKCKLRT